MDTREIRTTALPELEKGQIWGTKDLGVFVVISSRSAQWRGEDRDVYAHIDTWYTVRPANTSETELWNIAVNAASMRRAQRKLLHAEGFVYNDGKLMPTSSMRRTLDSYDDRWIPPGSITLTPLQADIENAYVAALSALKTAGGK